jgi:hypothetical protein
MQFTTSQPISILILASGLRLPSVFFLQVFHLSHACCMHHPSHPWFYHSNNIWWSVQIVKLIIPGCIQKFPDWVDNEMYNNKHSLRSNTKGYGGKTHWTDSQDSDTTAPSGRELYHLQFLLQAASLETFGYTQVKSSASLFGLYILLSTLSRPKHPQSINADSKCGFPGTVPFSLIRDVRKLWEMNWEASGRKLSWLFLR